MNYSYLGVLVALIATVIISAVSFAQDGSVTTDGNTTVNVSANQNTVVVVPSPKPQEPADAVVFYVTDDREVSTAGEIAVYRIVVRNQRNDDISQVRITVRIPDYLVPVATSPSADANPQARTLTWDNLTLSGRAEQTYAIRARIAPETPNNHSIRLVAEINGPAVRGNFTDTTLVESKQVIVSDQAATTTITLPSPAAPPTYPPAIPPTAKTGTDIGILFSLLSVAVSTGLAISYRHW